MCLLLISTSCSRKNKIIATFDNGQILQKELDFELLKYPEKDRKEILQSSRRIKPLLETIAIKKLAYLYAKKTNIINVSEISNNILNNYKNSLIQYLFSEKIKPREAKVKGSDIAKFSSQLKIKIIWLKTFYWMEQKQIDKIYKQAKKIIKLYKSGIDFGQLANEYSEDPGNFKNGRLGFILKNHFKPEVMDKIKKIKSGEISKVIQSELGYHVFKVLQIDNRKKPERINLAHILIKTNKNGKLRAEKILKMLKEGNDFSLMANKYSEDAGNFKNGNIPPFRFSKIYYSLANAAYKTKPGKISKIIKTRFGFFIIKNEKTNIPDKKQIKKLKSQERYLNNIINIKSRYYKDMKETELKEKIKNHYKIKFNAALITNKNSSPDDIIIFIPKIDLKILYKDCLPALKSIRPNFKVDWKTKASQIYEQKAFPEMVYNYAKDKGLHKNDEFLIKLYNRFYNTVYQKLINNLNLPIEINEDELKEYYKTYENRYYVTKVKNKKPTRVKQSFKEALEIVKNNVQNEKRKKAIEKWEKELLKKYNFNICLSKLGLKKNADYYIKAGDKAYKEKNYKKALKYFKKALKKDKEYTETYVKLILTFNKLGDSKNVLKIFEEFQKIKNIDVDLLLKYLTIDDKKLKLKFIEIIGLTGKSKAEKNLIELYKNEKDIKTLQALVRAIGLLKSKNAFSLLFKDLKNFSSRFKEYKENDREILKWYLIEAIGYIGNKKVSSYLTMMIKGTNDLNLKCFIIEALGRIKDKKSIPVLEKLLKDKVWGVRVLAAESLKNITGKKYKIEDKSKRALP